MFTNTHGKAVHAESISQLFDRHLARTDIPRIRFHDLRHTHASLLVAAGTDQSRVRTTRPRPPRLHDGHLSTPRARHERGRRYRLRQHDRRPPPRTGE
ncbi:MAG: hypothetical protein ABIR32_10225 [Ilumatobacteraceae bacterium]